MYGIKMNTRTSIYLSEPLQRVKSRIVKGESLSGRLAQICERYCLICNEVPELTSEERDAISSTLSEFLIQPGFILQLDTELDRFFTEMDTFFSDDSGSEELVQKIRNMTVAERVALIESLDL